MRRDKAARRCGACHRLESAAVAVPGTVPTTDSTSISIARRRDPNSITATGLRESPPPAVARRHPPVVVRPVSIRAQDPGRARVLRLVLFSPHHQTSFAAPIVYRSETVPGANPLRSLLRATGLYLLLQDARRSHEFQPPREAGNHGQRFRAPASLAGYGRARIAVFLRPLVRCDH